MVRFTKLCGSEYADVYRNMFQIVDAACMDDNMEELASRVDVIFTATPAGPVRFSGKRRDSLKDKDH